MENRQKACGTIPGALKPIGRVIDNNQPGWRVVVETEPNATLEVGSALFSAGDVWRAIGDLTCERDELLMERNKLVEEVSLLKGHGGQVCGDPSVQMCYVIHSHGAAFGPFSSEGHARLWAVQGMKGVEHQIVRFVDVLKDPNQRIKV